MFHYLFGFSGRINRAKQWAVLLVGLVFGIVISFAFSATIGGAALMGVLQGSLTVPQLVGTPQARLFFEIVAVLYLLGLYIGLAVATKRLHDRNRSAWWLLIFIVLPFLLNIPALMAMPAQMAHVGEVMRAAREHLPPPPMVEPPLVVICRGAATLLSLWAFVELYCLRGTVGDNRYGPDPLAGRD